MNGAKQHPKIQHQLQKHLVQVPERLLNRSKNGDGGNMKMKRCLVMKAKTSKSETEVQREQEARQKEQKENIGILHCPRRAGCVRHRP